MRYSENTLRNDNKLDLVLIMVYNMLVTIISLIIQLMK